MTWHIDERTWEAYAQGRLSDLAESSLETHVADCSDCQAAARAFGPDPARIWRSVRATITRPTPRWPVRWLRRLGFTAEDVVLLGGSDSLRLPWAVAIGGAIASVIAAGHLGRFDDAGFMLLSPLVPVLGVIAAFASTDPLRELTGSTPYSKVRLGLLRTVATLLVALPAMLGLCALVPVLNGLEWVWLVPSLALTGTALLLLRRFSSRHTAIIVSTAWAAVIVVTRSAGWIDEITSTTAQIAFAALTALAFIAYATTVPRPRQIGNAQ